MSEGKITADFLLESKSGFAMPFFCGEDEDLVINLQSGEQKHPYTGETFLHRGVDMATHGKPLMALATGTVVGVGNDAVHDNYVIVRYGKYEVKYGHISECFVNYGNSVTAGQDIAVSGDFLHFEVTIDGKALNPLDFMSIIYGNIHQLNALGKDSSIQFDSMGIDVTTDYDGDKEEILEMMSRWLPAYFNEIRKGTYAPPERLESSLRNVFAQSSTKRYFYEKVPTLSNPLGLSSRAAPLASKVQNLLISDFLCYMASRHGVYPSSWTDDQKKNFRSKYQPMVLS